MSYYEEYYEGFDARYWDGMLSPELVERFWFAGIKMSQAQWWNPSEGWALLQKQWQRAKFYGLMRLPFHYWLPPLTYQPPVEYGKNQGDNFYNTMLDKFGGDPGEMNPAIDVESRRVGAWTGVKRVNCLRACLDRTAELWNKPVMIYTAKWYWNVHIHPYVGDWKYWEEHELWEADPPPDTPIAGWVNGGPLTQMALGTTLPGFNTKIDIDEAEASWFEQFLPAPPPVDDCKPYKDRIEELETENAQLLVQLNLNEAECKKRVDRSFNEALDGVIDFAQDSKR
jgi:hypothetical protein